jgi:hypothetical protein
MSDRTRLPVFQLTDSRGQSHSFPSNRHALLCFVKEDCPTCHLSMDLIERAHRAFSGAIDVWAIGQDTAGNAALVKRYNLTLPMLDDSALRVSFSYQLDFVPTIILTDAQGAELRRFVGFGRQDWRDLYAEMARIAKVPAPECDWLSYPELRVGCGSKSVEPGIAERLAAETEGSPLRARRIDIAPLDDPFEFMFDQGFTDGLPVIPPAPERVLRMLGGTRRDAQEVIGIVPPNMAPVTIEKIAINAVMAGCKPEYLPVVIAAVDAALTPEFNAHGVMATTWGATPVIVVNGPIRNRIGMNMGMMALGYGNRANATIGRAVKLVLRNLGGARPGEIERSTFGSTGKFTTCFAEWEERSPWEPLHVERGFKREQSVVTLFGIESGSRQIADQTSRTAHALVGSLGLGLQACWHPKSYGAGDALLVVSPEHADTIARDKWGKADVRKRIQEVTSKPLRELIPDDDCGEGVPAARLGIKGTDPAQLEQRLSKFRSAANIHIVVAGGEAGKFSAIFSGWVSGPIGSIIVSRRIEEVA